MNHMIWSIYHGLFEFKISQSKNSDSIVTAVPAYVGSTSGDSNSGAVKQLHYNNFHCLVNCLT